MTTPEAPLAELVRRAASEFADLGFEGPDGRLDLDLAGRVVTAVRLQRPRRSILGLQSFAVDPAADAPAHDAPPNGAAVAAVRPSSWDPAFRRDDVASRLTAFDEPNGTVIQTREEDGPQIDLELDRPTPVARLRLRNGPEETPAAAHGLRVSVRGRWRWERVYDGATRTAAWRRLVDGIKPRLDRPGPLEVLDATVRAEYGRAHRLLPRRVEDESERAAFRALVNERLLPERGLEWTTHGPQRPFRVWSASEQVEYVRDAAEVVRALEGLTPNACLGFGSVLAVVRDRALIPHDDDLDVIVAFEPAEAATLHAALDRIEGHLRPLGFDVTGAFTAHRHVRRPGRKRVDVFVGIFEGDSIAWYPGPRGVITREMVFPPATAELLGVPCRIPADPEAYLERTYGPGWRTPDPFFSHAWNPSAYADLAGRR